MKNVCNLYTLKGVYNEKMFAIGIHIKGSIIKNVCNLYTLKGVYDEKCLQLVYI